MNQTMYTAISGMNAFQQALSVTSNNIANANTTGYKKQSVVFNDLLYQNTMGSVAGGLYAGTNPMSFGSGLKIGAILTDYTAGSQQQRAEIKMQHYKVAAFSSRAIMQGQYRLHA